MISATNPRRSLSAPLRVFWAGWESNTMELQRNGWEVSAEEDISQMKMRLAIRHTGWRVRGMSEAIYFPHYHEDFQYLNADHQRDILYSMVFPVQLANQFQVYSYEQPGIKFHPIDAEPRLTHGRAKNLDDLAHFQPLPSYQKAPQIILKEPTMNEILEMALKKQEPRQAEIRKELLKRQRMDEYYNQAGQVKAVLRMVA